MPPVVYMLMYHAKVQLFFWKKSLPRQKVEIVTWLVFKKLDLFFHNYACIPYTPTITFFKRLPNICLNDDNIFSLS